MKQPIKMTPGDDLHLTLLMAPHSLNLAVGQFRQQLLGYGRAAFEAGKAGQCPHQIQEPAPVTAIDALREAEAALEVAMARILKADPGHSICVTSEAKALVAVRAALAAPAAVAVQLDANGIAQCPLCGSESKHVQAGVGGHRILCWNDDCECSSGYFCSKEEAITSWNARAALAATPAAEHATLPAELATQAAQPVLPTGWVPCVLTYEGQHPEEVAYGPQIMMDRLKKWLERYFEMKAAAPVVLPEPVSDEQIKAVFLANGFTIKEGLTDLKPYVYQAARALLATGGQAQAVEQAPVLYVSKGQLDNHRDPDGPDSANAGRYLPCRITPAGKFTTPLFAAPQAQAGARDAGTFEQRMSDWSQEDAIDAERYRFIVEHKLILSGGTEKFGWPIAPFGVECHRYIDAARAAIAAAKGK